LSKRETEKEREEERDKQADRDMGEKEDIYR